MFYQQRHADGLAVAYRAPAAISAISERPAHALALPKIVAVIVARDRPDDLRDTAAAVLAQCAPAEVSTVIVDSSQNGSMSAQLARQRDTTVLPSRVNLGGAGGYALGLMSAIAAGAEWIWLMDDDGRPMDAHVLGHLLETAREHGLDAVAPVVLDAEDITRFAFPYPIQNRYVFNRAELAEDAFIPGVAHLFNGLLIRAQAIFRIGLPDLRLFIRGDEIDFLHRMQRAGLAFGTTATAHFSHPSSQHELVPVFGGRLHVVYPAQKWKRCNQYRNRAYNFTTHRKYVILAADFIRYPYFFVIRRKGDFAGLGEWLACTWAGLRGQVHVDPAIDLAPRIRDASAP